MRARLVTPPPSTLRIAQPFEILGLARDAADASGQSGDWGKLIRFKNSDGIEIERVVTSLRCTPTLAP
jgi:hypothetical protein